MPKYAYACAKCGATFDKSMPMSQVATAKVACPTCGSKRVRRKPAVFNSVGGGRAMSSASAPDCAPGGG